MTDKQEQFLLNIVTGFVIFVAGMISGYAWAWSVFK